jgi:hypothetical protein
MGEQEIEFEFNFTDETILETDGEYAEVVRLMDEEEVSVPEWYLKSILTIESDIGMARFSLNFWHNGRIIINEYDPSLGDVAYNPDLQALTAWASAKGWKVPEPNEMLVRQNIEFWKDYWETLLIDSPYLDELFGVRPQLRPDFGQPSPDPDEDVDEEA